MLNNTWSTIGADGNIKYFETVKEPTYNPEIEKYTDYEFSNSNIINSTLQEMGNDVEYTYQNFESVFSDVGSGIKSGAKVFKYLPLIAISLGSFILLKKTKAI